MKPEDALESLCEDCVDFPCYALRHRDRCLQYHTLKKVIEKQIPKKPVYAATKKYKNIFDGSEVEVHELESCPVCGFYPLETKYVRLHSCPECNQRIDWGEADG